MAEHYSTGSTGGGSPLPKQVGSAPQSIVEKHQAAYDQMVKASRHPGSARFHQILAELGELHDRKQADYGRSLDPFANVRASRDWGTPSWVGAMIRATDKLRRLQTYAEKGTLANEGVEDSLRDLAVYSVIALVLWEDEVANTASGK